MEILQDFESVKWRRLLVRYICMLVICLAAIIFVIVYDKASLWGGSAAIALMITIPISFVSSSKCIARNLAIDDDNLYFNYMIGSILLPLSEIASIEKADDQLYGRGRGKLMNSGTNAERVYGLNDKKNERKKLSNRQMTYAGWCKRGTEHVYYLFSAQRDNHALITTKSGKLYVVDYENAEAIKQKAGLN